MSSQQLPLASGSQHSTEPQWQACNYFALCGRTVASISSMSGSGSLAASHGMTRSSNRSGIARSVRHT
jgi:hypothetical protein